jgi:hypothetical protein
MISELSFINLKNEKFLINTGVNVSPFPILKTNPDGSYVEAFLHKRCGLEWRSNGQVFSLLNGNGEFLTGYPDCEMNAIIAIYAKDSKTNPSPRNAIIYNEDKSVRMFLEVPDELLSDNAQRIRPNKSDCYFQQAGWSINSKGEKVTHVWICFARGEYFEVRELNTQTGEIGDLLTYGRM